MNKVLQFDKWCREIAGTISSKVKSSTGLAPKYLMWVVLGKALLLSFFVGAGVAFLALAAIVVLAIWGCELLEPDETGAKFRVSVTAALVTITLLSSVLGIWPLYLTVVGIWIGAANWQRPKSPAPPEG